VEREKLLNQYRYGYVLFEGTKQMKMLYQFCRENMEQLCKKLNDEFQQLIENTKDAQKKKTERNIFCINFSVLRTLYLQRDGKVRISAFDERFYLDTEAIWTEWDASILFQYLWDLEDNLYQSLSDFKGILTSNDLKYIMLTEYVPYLIQCLTEIIRYGIRKGYLYGFKELSVTEDFNISVGEYRGSFDEVYISKKLWNHNSELLELLENYKENHTQFYSRKYENMIMTNNQLERINFTKSSFYKINMSGSNLEEAYLLKTSFIDCILKNISWKRALLFDTDFSGSDLSEGDFTNSMASVTEPGVFNRNIFSLIGADFSKANLSKTDFSRSNFSGADFRNAIFNQTKFTGARLHGARFKKEILPSLQLTQDQLREIQICG
jgi:uncharacterized protein YjbI with pentapeptide repeats